MFFPDSSNGWWLSSEMYNSLFCSCSRSEGKGNQNSCVQILSLPLAVWPRANCWTYSAKYRSHTVEPQNVCAALTWPGPAHACSWWQQKSRLKSSWASRWDHTCCTQPPGTLYRMEVARGPTSPSWASSTQKPNCFTSVPTTICWARNNALRKSARLGKHYFFANFDYYTNSNYRNIFMTSIRKV